MTACALVFRNPRLGTGVAAGPRPVFCRWSCAAPVHRHPPASRRTRGWARNAWWPSRASTAKMPLACAGTACRSCVSFGLQVLRIDGDQSVEPGRRRALGAIDDQALLSPDTPGEGPRERAVFATLPVRRDVVTVRVQVEGDHPARSIE